MAQTRIQGFLSFLRRYPVITFLLQQIFLFVAAVIFLTTVRKLTGKTIHGGKDPLGLGDGVAALLLFALFVLLTVWFYRVVMSKDAPPLGLNPSIRSIPEFVLD